ncbi:gamma-glutamyl-gamma-aminobutyrate hydrolase family protein [Alphaproteobacteria bacterium]|nr:gamma-glutamyl-gamma-aminobutyrate hydrolase family protein [Alphaproteobacteria bacterium]
MLIGVTMRVDRDNQYEEIRDSLDTKWYNLFQNSNITPFLFPNNLQFVQRQLKQINFDGFILTGGGDVVSSESKFDQEHERYLIEVELLKNSAKNNIPVLGVCRGFQSMLIQAGGELEIVLGHVANDHDIYIEENEKRLLIGKVNSYHKYGISLSNLPSEYKPVTFDLDGHVEGAYHKSYPWMGIMWHPERGKGPLCAKILNLFLNESEKNKSNFSWSQYF